MKTHEKQCAGIETVKKLHWKFHFSVFWILLLFGVGGVFKAGEQLRLWVEDLRSTVLQLVMLACNVPCQP